jgi:nucleoside-diphosphate-sugar epimerase/quercetin dioxygenase-like cupin family protein
MEKIVITGGLGYIGSELCKLYSGEARFKNITVVDKRFVSERVKQLRDWGINFIQASILDEDTISKIVKDADVVIHLAGITDVAYTKTESNEAQDNEIRITGIDGTRNIIKYVKKDCKLIFPSTHVVYEGFAETKTDILETEPTCAVLTYSTGKVQSETDLQASSVNYIILRLGSVYGYSTDTMRMGIMPNLFSKIASQDGTIKLFSGGVQLKSLVSVFDVARCMKFMAEKTDIQREIFHLAKENMTVKQVAEICKQSNPKLNIIETQDQIPNLGYTISNAKLLSTGFEFRYNIEQCLKEMITNWSVKNINQALEYIDRGGKEFVDSRGRINNYELTEPINLIGYIESKKGTVRANHYHPVQEQKCLLVKGQYISIIKDLSIPNAQIETRVINEGDIAIIKPNVAHSMVFTEDSIFLNLVRGEREHENYGVSHTIPYKLVDDEMRDKLLSSYKTTCRCCNNKHLERVVSLGASPLANNLTDSSDIKSETYPLEMNYCPKCHNCQLSVVVPPEKMFDNYLYVSSTAASFRKHFEDVADKYINELGLNSNTLVVDIGSNDGIALKPLMEKGIRILGVEPAKNIAELARNNKIKTLNSYFDMKTANKITKNYGKAKLVTASNVFAHSDKLAEIAKGAFEILETDGTFIIEVQYLLDTIKDMTFDNIYHEHTNYWSVTSINNFFNSLNLSVVKVEHINTHGGSIRVYVKNLGNTIDASVDQFLHNEISFGLTKLETYKSFGVNVEKIKQNVKTNISKLKQQYDIICGYGSPAKATTSLNYYGLTSKELEYTVDDNPLKTEKYIPCVNIPIKNKEYFLNNIPKAVIVLAWNFFDYIKVNNQNLIDKGVVFINIKELENESVDFIFNRK